jgi:hypothetical protein
MVVPVAYRCKLGVEASAAGIAQAAVMLMRFQIHIDFSSLAMIAASSLGWCFHVAFERSPTFSNTQDVLQNQRDYPHEGYLITFELKPEMPFKKLLLLDAALQGLRTFDGQSLAGEFFYRDVRLVSAYAVEGLDDESSTGKDMSACKIGSHASTSRQLCMPLGLPMLSCGDMSLQLRKNCVRVNVQGSSLQHADGEEHARVLQPALASFCQGSAGAALCIL